jgi:hypothetical protein
MSLLDSLRQLGGRLGIIGVKVAAKANTPEKIITREMSLAELGQITLKRQPSSAIVDFNADFPAICTNAGITPSKGWNTERLTATLRSDELRGCDRPQAQQRILTLLQADGVAPEDIVKDAVACDQAIDEYAEKMRQNLARALQQRTRRAAEIGQQIAALEAERKQLADENEAQKRAWAAWWKRKHANEETLAWAIGHLLEKPLVTVDERLPEIDGAGTT